ncbi:hypothetical protein [Microbulbifer agarilyticus]
MSVKIAVMTFAYEGDREIGFDMLNSLLRSFGNTKFDLYFTDDASPSRLDRDITSWAEQHNLVAKCIRYEENLGFRGAGERTLSLLKLIAQQPVDYDLILRIDTDALVIREGLDKELYRAFSDKDALYGVLKPMRPKDRIGYLLDLFPFGFKRKLDGHRLSKRFSFSRFSPVWWWRAGVSALIKGFKFHYVEGSCYFMGGNFPKVLLKSGFLDLFDKKKHGLITSEEDVLVTTLCRAAGSPLIETDNIDARWRRVNIIGKKAVEEPVDNLPWVMHALKATPKDAALRSQVHNTLPLFNASNIGRPAPTIANET